MEDNLLKKYYQKKPEMGKNLLELLSDKNIIKYNEVTFKKGETIFKQNVFISHIIYIKKGIVKVVLEGKNNKEIILDFGIKDWMIGFSMLKDYESYPFSVTALTETEVFLYKLEDINALIPKNNDISTLLTDWMRLNHNLFYHKVLSLGTKSMFGRLAESLILLSNPCFQKVNIFKYISRKDIAEFAGMSLESMVRIINELKNDKIIEVKNKNIEIKDLEMLKLLSKVG